MDRYELVRLESDTTIEFGLRIDGRLVTVRDSVDTEEMTALRNGTSSLLLWDDESLSRRSHLAARRRDIETGRTVVDVLFTEDVVSADAFDSASELWDWLCKPGYDPDIVDFVDLNVEGLLEVFVGLVRMSATRPHSGDTPGYDRAAKRIASRILKKFKEIGSGQ